MPVSESIQALAFVMLVVFLTYVTLIVLPFARRRPDPEGDPGGFAWHAFVPCRDEETVIGATVTLLRTRFPAMHVWVVDDASVDRTAEVVSAAAVADPMVHLVRRVLPDARQGKGAALNRAYTDLGAFLPPDTDRERVVVVVVDADGRLASNALRQAAGPVAFGNPATGAAQAAVWMSNRGEREPVAPRWPAALGRAARRRAARRPGARLRQWWARYLVGVQDIEFRTTIAAMQCLRGRTVSVGLGGNGQFTRLSVLDAIARTAGSPWHGSLLEDYELGIHVMFEGFQNVYMHDTWVEQEALTSGRRLLTQRTRWCQGGMQCSRYLGAIFRSRHITNAGAIEAAYFLLQPYLQLVGVVLWPTVLVVTVVQGSQAAGGFVAWAAASVWVAPLVVVTGIAPFAIWPVLYRWARCADWHPGSTVAWALGYWLYQYAGYVVVVRAFARVLAGDARWSKTRRNAEPRRLAPTAAVGA